MSLIQDALKRQQQEHGNGEQTTSDPAADAPRADGSENEIQTGQTASSFTVPNTMPIAPLPKNKASRPWVSVLTVILIISAIIAAVIYLATFSLSLFMKKKDVETVMNVVQPASETQSAPKSGPAEKTPAPNPETTSQPVTPDATQTEDQASPAQQTTSEPALPPASESIPPAPIVTVAPGAVLSSEPTPATITAPAPVPAQVPTLAAPAAAKPVQTLPQPTPPRPEPESVPPPIITTASGVLPSSAPIPATVATPAPAPAQVPPLVAPAAARPVQTLPPRPPPTPEPTIETVQMEWPSLKLSAIMRGKSPNRGAAMLNGRIVEVGEEIEGVILIKVEEDGVKLKNGSEVRTLKIGGIL